MTPTLVPGQTEYWEHILENLLSDQDTDIDEETGKVRVPPRKGTYGGIDGTTFVASSIQDYSDEEEHLVEFDADHPAFKRFSKEQIENANKVLRSKVRRKLSEKEMNKLI